MQLAPISKPQMTRLSDPWLLKCRKLKHPLVTSHKDSHSNEKISSSNFLKNATPSEMTCDFSVHLYSWCCMVWNGQPIYNKLEWSNKTVCHSCMKRVYSRGKSTTLFIIRLNHYVLVHYGRNFISQMTNHSKVTFYSWLWISEILHDQNEHRKGQYSNSSQNDYCSKAF